MANIFYAWEFGANLGHIGPFLSVARGLRERGHTVHWAVAHPHQAARLLPDAGFDWFAAPVMPEQRREGVPLSYADILLRFGYAQAEDLLGLVVAWRQLLKLTRTELVVADHAPTAILAARTLGLPAMLFGSGFFCPPPLSPTPAMRTWQPVPIERLQAIDDQALCSMNTVLTRFERAPLQQVVELFEVAETSLLSFPELDHYEQRGPARYWGMLPATVAQAPQWPDCVGPRVFAYLRPECAHFIAALEALAQLKAAVLIYVPNLPTDLHQRYNSTHLRFAAQPVDLDTVADEADAVLTYASAAATAAALFAGKPVLMLPSHLEQFLFARRVEQMGAGRLIGPDDQGVDLPGCLTDVLTTPAYRQNAQAFARKYVAFDQGKVADNLIRRIEKITKETRP